MSDDANTASGGGPEVDPAEAQALLSEGAQLVDVRTLEEWERVHVPGSMRIELDELTGRSDEIAQDRPVVFLCRSGSRSHMAAEAFRGAGYDARNLAGGIIAWIEAGQPREPADATPEAAG